MKRPLRVAVLECDVPLTNTKAKYGGYGGVFEALLQASVKALNQPDLVDPESGLEISKWNVSENPDSYPNLEDIDAILMTGSSMVLLSVMLIYIWYFASANFCSVSDRIQLI